MIHKVKSSLCFESHILAVVSYYSFDGNDTIHNSLMAEKVLERLATDKTIH